MHIEIIRRTCDWCNASHDFKKQQGMTEGEAQEMSNWFTLAREYVVQGQIFPVVKHACSPSCAENVIKLDMLALPQNVQEFVDAKKARGAN